MTSCRLSSVMTKEVLGIDFQGKQHEQTVAACLIPFKVLRKVELSSVSHFLLQHWHHSPFFSCAQKSVLMKFVTDNMPVCYSVCRKVSQMRLDEIKNEFDCRAWHLVSFQNRPDTLQPLDWTIIGFKHVVKRSADTNVWMLTSNRIILTLRITKHVYELRLILF